MRLLLLCGLVNFLAGYRFYMNDKPFLSMSDACWVAPGEKYTCEDIPDILGMDPYEQKDVDYVCNCSRTTGFTNKQLAQLSTKRLHDYGFDDCTVSVLDGLENKQLKKQCPTFYKEKCGTVSLDLLINIEMM